MLLVSVYRGTREGSSCRVTVNGKPLDPRPDLRDNAVERFDWGSEGPGATQLALAILAHHAGDDVALRVHRKFVPAVIAGLPFEGWTLKGDDVDMALAVLEIQPLSGAFPRPPI
jgi:hypothetical protein